MNEHVRNEHPHEQREEQSTRSQREPGDRKRFDGAIGIRRQDRDHLVIDEQIHAAVMVARVDWPARLPDRPQRQLDRLGADRQVRERLSRRARLRRRAEGVKLEVVVLCEATSV